MIDLHLHTTASDGRGSPEDVIKAARSARLQVVSIVDHDTVAGLPGAARACAVLGVELVSGIEITAVRQGEDVHVLGYFFDPEAAMLVQFLEAQRVDRVRRVEEMLGRLADLGVRLDRRDVLNDEVLRPGRAAGRPLIARAMVRAGIVRTSTEAFDFYLGQNGAAFVARRGSSPEEVVSIIHGAGGIASLAHPGMLGHDEWLDRAGSDGFDAIEAYHSSHSDDTTARCRAAATRLGLGISGGSDYHGDPSHGPARPGETLLPEAAYADLCVRAGRAGGTRT